MPIPASGGGVRRRRRREPAGRTATDGTIADDSCERRQPAFRHRHRQHEWRYKNTANQFLIVTLRFSNIDPVCVLCTLSREWLEKWRADGRTPLQISSARQSRVNKKLERFIGIAQLGKLQSQCKLAKNYRQLLIKLLTGDRRNE